MYVKVRQSQVLGRRSLFAAKPSVAVFELVLHGLKEYRMRLI